MDAIRVSKKLNQAFIDYLSTIFDVNRDGQEAKLAQAIRASFETHGALMNGPYLELTPPYIRSQSIHDLCQQTILSPSWETLPHENLPVPRQASLYAHQVKAIQRLCVENRGIVVSSGTGSGKTESFLIPILDDLLKDNRPGVRAILIYPMNALVNDQLDRLRK